MKDPRALTGGEQIIWRISTKVKLIAKLPEILLVIFYFQFFFSQSGAQFGACVVFLFSFFFPERCTNVHKNDVQSSARIVFKLSFSSRDIHQKVVHKMLHE